MTDPVRWLDGREPAAPPALRAVVDAYIATTDGSRPLPERLADAALTALDAAVRGASDRSSATTLLAADALLTYACEAAAEVGPDALEGLARSLSFERFSNLMPDAP